MKSQNPTDTPDTLILKEGEKLIWSGRPDMQAVVITNYRGHRQWNKYAAVTVVCWIVYALWDRDQGNTYDWRLLVFAGISAVVAYYSAIRAKNELNQWMKHLSYAITNQRVIILRNGTVENEYSQGDVMQASLIPRKGVPGFSDIIWEKRSTGTSGSNNRIPTPLTQEKALIGFKALADSEGVMKILEDWVTTQKTATYGEDAAFVDTKLTENTNSETLVSPVYGFSVEFPSSWEITSRYRRLAFGKWGIEREAIWSTPAEKPKWNVIRGQNDSRTYVEIQVQKTAPFNTLESMMDTSKAASFLGTGEVIDHDASISINGVPGFYVTRKMGNPDSILPSEIQDKLAYWHMRQYVLHDGQYQYYIEAVWPVENSQQRITCEAIIASLKPSA